MATSIIPSNTQIILNKVYPVGSIYMSVDSTNPSTLFGGSWSRITGQFLLAATDGGSSGASQAAGRTGGSATRTLTTSNVPSHDHYVRRQHNSGTSTGTALAFDTNVKYLDTSMHTVGISNSTYGQAFEIMPPYLAVYVWKRTA